MKAEIHPQYYPQAKVKCACGNRWTTGSTLPEINVEICNQCHPFYTGRDKLLDARGRIDKFNKKLDKIQSVKARPPKKPRLKKAKA